MISLEFILVWEHMFTPFEILIDMYNWHLRCRSIQQEFLKFIVQLLHKKASNIEKVLLENALQKYTIQWALKSKIEHADLATIIL